MKPTDFAKGLSEFLGKYLPHERGVSSNTITAYRDTFVMLIKYMELVKIRIEKLTLDLITRERIAGFLDWLEHDRKCSTATRNVRLAAIHSFFSYMQHSHPETLFQSQAILSMKMKKYNKPAMSYLSIDGIKLLLQQPDVTTSYGRRDLALLSLMYDTGCRVQEIVDLTPNMVRLSTPSTICIRGKGKKMRIVPMLDEQVKLLENYMKERRLLEPHAGTYPLFCNNKREKLTRAGVTYILLKYASAAKEKNANLIPEKISCHSLRHSKAMHLLQAGVNLVYIRDILGHVSITTTEIYARADSRQKREALEKAYTNVAPFEVPSWLANDNLLQWLKSL